MDKSEKEAAQLRFLIGLAFWAAILGLVYAALRFICLALPLLLALILAALVRPAARFLSRETRVVRRPDGERVLLRRKLHLNAALAGVISVLALFALLGGTLVLLTFRAAGWASQLVSALPDFFENQLEPGMEALYRRLLEGSRRFDPQAAPLLSAALPELSEALGSLVTGATGGVLRALTALAAALPGALFTAMITVIAAVFLSVDYERFRCFLRRNLPARPLHYLMTVRNSFVDTVGRLLRSYLILALITGAECALGLWLIRVEQPLLLGGLIGAVDIFPVVGSGTVLLPWALFCALSGQALRGGKLLALYLVITLARQFLEPRIVGGRVGLRPIVSLSCMVLGGRLFGAVGLLALPVMAAILTDLNRSGVIKLFRRPEAPEEDEKIIHSEGIDA